MAEKTRVLSVDGVPLDGLDPEFFEVKNSEPNEKGPLIDALKGFQPHALVVRSATVLHQPEIERMADQLAQVRLIIRAGVGLDNLDIQALSKLGIAVKNTPAANRLYTTERTLDAMHWLLAGEPERQNPKLVESRSRLQATDPIVDARKIYWNSGEDASYWNGAGVSLAGRKIAVVGHGAIGAAVTNRLLALEAQPVVVTRRTDQISDSRIKVAHSITEALRDHAIEMLSLHVKGGPETEKLLDTEILKMIWNQRVKLLNMARGSVVNEEALLELVAADTLDALSDVLTIEGQKLLHGSRDYAELSQAGRRHVDHVLTPLINHPRFTYTWHSGAAVNKAVAENGREAVAVITNFFDSQ